MKKLSKILIPLVLILVFTESATAQPKFRRNRDPEERTLQIEQVVSPEGITEQIIRHKGFTVSYNEALLIPNWVAWELTDTEASADVVSRTDEFLPDPAVRGRQADTRDYSNTGYDRGHMAAAADMKWDKQAMVESFYMTNICPQNRQLNAGLWLEIEQKCRWWAKKYGTLWIACGPIFVRNEAQALGRSEVAIPDAFFKCVAMKVKDKGAAERWTIVAFVLPNTDLDGTSEDYMFPVANIEALTGYTFFQTLPVDADTLWALKTIVTDRDWTIPGWKKK